MKFCPAQRESRSRSLNCTVSERKYVETKSEGQAKYNCHTSTSGDKTRKGVPPEEISFRELKSSGEGTMKAKVACGLTLPGLTAFVIGGN